jgi:FixJ family two-component response regulator
MVLDLAPRSFWQPRMDTGSGPEPAVECYTGVMLSDQLLISIIDDDQPFRESMRRLMRSFGYTVDVFSSAAEFLVSPRLSETSCLIADVHMPAMTGIELYQHLLAAGHAIPTILVTAYSNDVDRVRALNDVVICYLRKPVNEENLSRCLRAALTSGKTP